MKKALPFIQKFGAEMFGTLILSLVVLMSLMSGIPGLLVALFAGLTLTLFVYTIGHISGTHINPGVTIGAFLINKIDWKDALVYLAAQFAGAGVALAIAAGFAPEPGLGAFFAQVAPTVENTIRVGLAEAIGMVIFTFGIASVVYGRNEKGASGFIIGASLFMGLLVALMIGSAGVLNPAVGLAVGHFNAMYILGPIVGSIVGMWLFTLLDMDIKKK
ncbi:aquaporin [Candidatus Nomurabacteria bacterium]|nr:aquaporin [Candidatus Nomurabacteria bacterium]